MMELPLLLPSSHGEVTAVRGGGMEEDEVEEIPPPGGGPRSWGDPAMVAMAESESDEN